METTTTTTTTMMMTMLKTTIAMPLLRSVTLHRTIFRFSAFRSITTSVILCFERDFSDCHLDCFEEKHTQTKKIKHVSSFIVVFFRFSNSTPLLELHPMSQVLPCSLVHVPQPLVRQS
jgi:hypothetical protein